MFRSRAEAKVREAGFDPARLPPGQYLTDKWPVLHAGSVPAVDIATWTLRIWGEVEQKVTLTFEQLTALPTREITRDIHCVTRWSRFDLPYRGVHWSELAKLVRPTAGGPLTPDHGFPVRLIAPSRYFWKSTKWLTGIELLAHDKPGFWERYGYNNNADYWAEERYSGI